MKKSKSSLPGTSMASKLVLWLLIKPYLFLVSKVFHRVKFIKDGFIIPKGPVFFIGNHHTNWDGFYQAVMLYWRFPHFLVTDEVFRNRVFKLIFGQLLGQISRRDNIFDREPYIIMKRLIEKGKSISLFPEGDIEMFGRSLPVDESVAKLAKFLDLPIILLKIEGGHLRYPRWRYKPFRQKRIVYRVSNFIPVEEVRTLSKDDLHQKIVTSIVSNEYDYVQEHGLVVKNHFNRAKWLELGVYLCPHCYSFNSFHSKNNHLTCQTCHLTIEVDRQTFLHYPSPNYIARLDEYDDFQKAYLDKYLDEERAEVRFTLKTGLFEIKPLDNYFSYKGQTAEAELTQTKIILKTVEKVYEIPLNKIERVRLQHKQVLEIWFQGEKYRLWSSKRPWSAYMWVIFIELAKEKGYNNIR